MPKIALIGFGNVLFKDEGIGIYGAKYIKENYSFNPSIDIIDGGTLGMSLVSLLYEYDAIIIMNTCSSKVDRDGTVTCRKADAFLEEQGMKKSINEIEIADILHTASFSNTRAQTTVISMVPEDIQSVNIGLSVCMIKAFAEYIQTTLEVLEGLNIKITRKKKGMELERILEIFSHLSVEFKRGF